MSFNTEEDKGSSGLGPVSVLAGGGGGGGCC